VTVVGEAKTGLSRASFKEACDMPSDTLLEAVNFYKRQLLEHLEHYPDATPDELVSMLDDDVMGDLPSGDEVAAAEPQRFERMLMEDVPLRRWEQLSDMAQRPTIGWMMMRVLGDHVRWRALAELRETLPVDDWRAGVVGEMLAIEWRD
jgi:hypothetical protein